MSTIEQTRAAVRDVVETAFTQSVYDLARELGGEVLTADREKRGYKTVECNLLTGGDGHRYLTNEEQAAYERWSDAWESIGLAAGFDQSCFHEGDNVYSTIEINASMHFATILLPEVPV
jgi:hypothetical protein